MPFDVFELLGVQYEVRPNKCQSVDLALVVAQRLSQLEKVKGASTYVQSTMARKDGSPSALPRAGGSAVGRTLGLSVQVF